MKGFSLPLKTSFTSAEWSGLSNSVQPEGNIQTRYEDIEPSEPGARSGHRGAGAVHAVGWRGGPGYGWHGGYGWYGGGPVWWGAGVGLGLGLGWAYVDSPYAYYPYAPAYVPYAVAPAPVTAAPTQSSAAAGTWYFCEPAKAYYPYVRECAQPWQAVPAVPPQPAQ